MRKSGVPCQLPMPFFHLIQQFQNDPSLDGEVGLCGRQLQNFPSQLGNFLRNILLILDEVDNWTHMIWVEHRVIDKKSDHGFPKRFILEGRAQASGIYSSDPRLFSLQTEYLTPA